MEQLAVLSGILAARAAGEPCAVATVVNVIGSAYRREGTAMLIREGGEYTCMVSGGCLEPEIVFLGQQVMASGTPVLMRYNLDEERMFGLGIGCAGEVDIFVERVEETPALARWWQATERGEHAALVTRLDETAARVCVTPLEAVGDLGAHTGEAVRRARELLAQQHPKPHPFTLDGARYFLDLRRPPPELLLFGASHDSVPLAELGRRAGFHVRVADMRPDLLTAGRFPGAELHLMEPSGFPTLTIHPHTHAVVMNHHFLVDRASLKFLLGTPAAYIGLLGPRSRLEKIAQAARDDGALFAPEDLARVHNPIGLAIGAESPDEVALSVISELLAVSRGFTGGFLNGHAGKIHEPQDRAAVQR